VLTQLSAFWFRQTRAIVPNHLITDRIEEYPEALRGQAAQLRGRSMLVRKARRIDVECVARGYLAGSAWAEYREHGTVAGEPLSAGLRLSDALPRPVFTPATKAASGHDQNISRAELRDLVGADLADRLERVTLDIYRYADRYARSRGIIIADTKLEFGLLDGELLLIDELLSPDSSRFWPVALYRPGEPQPSFDKQYLRDWLEGIGWDKEPPAPALPPDVVAQTSEKYIEAFRLLTGRMPELD
jgi:phosphoribosylaminoimidazole-succinocarboxamide synthase